MTSTQGSLMMIVVLTILLLAYVIYIVSLKKKNQRRSKIIKYKHNKRNHVYLLYKFYVKTPLLNRYFKKMVGKLETMYPADRIAITVKATKDMSIALLSTIACGAVIVLFSKGDVFFIGIGIVLVYVLFTQLLNTQIEKMEKKLDEQFADFLTDVRHYYHDTQDVCDAVYATLDELPYEISLHINKIHTVLSSTHSEQEVTKYTDVAPNRFLMMFAAICSTIKEYGDKKLEDGQWLFVNNLEYIKEELNIEILKKKQNNYLFSGLKFVAIAPIFLLKPIELWATSNVPEMASFYKDGSGTIVMAITFALSMACYQLICNLKDGRVDDLKENTLLNRLVNLPIIRGALTAEVNRNYSKSLRIGDNLKSVGENIGPKGFLLKRVLYGIAFAIAFNVVVIFSQALAKDALLHDFADSFTNSIVPSTEYRENMQAISENYVGIVRNLDEYESHHDELVEKVVREENIKKTFAEEIIDEVFKRVGELKEIYYKWYMALGTIAAFIGGFYVPMFFLWYQLSIMKMNMEDEVVQFQTIALILSHVNGITIDALLEWMERFSFCFKNSISECILNLEYSIQDSLKKMKDKEPFPPFKRFVDNLLSIDNIGMVAAFDELASERDYYKKKREQDNNIIQRTKASRGKLIAFVPLIGAIGGYMIFPFLQMAINMMSTMTDAIKTLG